MKVKKSVAIIACVSITLLYGMEQQEPHTFAFLVKSTEIQLIHGPLYNADTKKVDIVWAGRKEQRILQAPSFGDSNCVGKIYESDNNIYYPKNPYGQEYCPFKYNDKTLWKDALKKEMSMSVIHIVEPTIAVQKNYNTDKNYFCYYALHDNRDRGMEDRVYEVEAFGQEAISQASIDLDICYTSVLINTIEQLKTHKKYRIALQSLSTHVGFPLSDAAPVAVKSIVDYIKKHSTHYECVCLFVDTDAEFNIYKECFEKMMAQK
jgi:hypothetical protein